MLLIKYWKSIILTLLILILSFAKLPSTDKFPPEILWDKIAHFFMYFSLTFILMYDFYKGGRPTNKKGTFMLICIVYPILLGIFTEIGQALVFTSRAAEWYDWVSNIAGFFAGGAFFMIFKRKLIT